MTKSLKVEHPSFAEIGMVDYLRENFYLGGNFSREDMLNQVLLDIFIFFKQFFMVQIPALFIWVGTLYMFQVIKLAIDEYTYICVFPYVKSWFTSLSCLLQVQDEEISSTTEQSLEDLMKQMKGLW